MSERSYAIAKQRFKRDISKVIDKVDVATTGLLTFDTLGELMHLLSIYKILYNDKHGIHSKPTSTVIACDNCNHSEPFLIRQAKENNFHINLWKFLTNGEHAKVDVVKEMLLLMFDSGNSSLGVLAMQLDSLSENNPYAPKKGRDYDELWTSSQLITAFKELNASPFLISNLLRGKEISKDIFNYYPFAPSINSKSQILDEQQLRKYSSQPFDELSNGGPGNSHRPVNAQSEPSTKNTTHTRSRSGENSSHNSSNLSHVVDGAKENLSRRIERMFERRKRSLDKVRQIRIEEERKEKSQCTFKPSITSYVPDTSTVLFSYLFSRLKGRRSRLLAR
eukprot:TRINITY_DN10827_c0_g3_i3.p1 TRINITY_DN10827_c0_g3~~TRINITY_DN10827_c0_g3_i3.p1  ORF type:complete len:335 (-),score=37.12 TRINITY_DN10827_c0_g3_i3:358-1362(-)